MLLKSCELHFDYKTNCLVFEEKKKANLGLVILTSIVTYPVFLLLGSVASLLHFIQLRKRKVSLLEKEKEKETPDIKNVETRLGKLSEKINHYEKEKDQLVEVLKKANVDLTNLKWSQEPFLKEDLKTSYKEHKHLKEILFLQTLMNRLFQLNKQKELLSSSDSKDEEKLEFIKKIKEFSYIKTMLKIQYLEKALQMHLTNLIPGGLIINWKHNNDDKKFFLQRTIDEHNKLVSNPYLWPFIPPK